MTKAIMLIVMIAIACLATLVVNIWVSIEVAKQSGHSAYGWACFLILGYLMNISYHSRK
jgi:uncharacterized membrane protein HdeD (DUF308 family)